MIHRKGHHRDKRPSMVSEMGGRIRGSYGNILQNNYNSRTNTFGNNRAISLDHYSNHRRMSDGIQTVTSDSTVYYHQRLHDQDNLLLRAANAGKSASCQTSSEVKLLVSSGEETMKCPVTIINDPSDTNRVQSSNNNNNNNSSNNNCTTSSVTSKNAKSKLSSSVTCSNSPKSIITRLRQLTGRLSFSFEKDISRRSSSGGGGGGGNAPQASITKTSISPPSKNNNMMPNICCNTKSAIGSAACNDSTSRNRAYSLDVPPMKFNYNSSGASSNNGSHKSLSSTTNRNEEVVTGDESTDTNSAVFASKKMSAAEVEPMDM